MRAAMVRLKTNRRAKVPYRLLSIAQLLQRAPEVVVRVGVARIQAKRFGELRDCLIVSALRDEHVAQISVSHGTCRRVRRQQLNRTPYAGDGRIGLPSLIVRVSEIVPGAAILRPLPDRVGPNGDPAV